MPVFIDHAASRAVEFENPADPGAAPEAPSVILRDTGEDGAYATPLEGAGGHALGALRRIAVTVEFQTPPGASPFNRLQPFCV